MKLSAIGGGGIKNFTMIDFTFDCDNQCTIEEARKKFIEKVEYLLLLINKNEKLRPYMANYPFDISILYISKNQTWYSTSYISSVGNNGNKIVYMQINNEPNASPLFNIIHRETYEEAKNIVLNSMKDK